MDRTREGTMRAVHGLFAAVTVALALACDDSSGPGGLEFPALSPALRSTFCVMGNVTVGESPSGALTSSDCDSADIDPGDTGYYEVYLVKVTGTRSVTFDVNSNFDSFLTLLRLDSFNATSASLSGLAENDDRSVSDFDALLTFTLQAGTNYVIAVGGYDYSETGSYTLQIR